MISTCEGSERGHSKEGDESKGSGQLERERERSTRDESDRENRENEEHEREEEKGECQGGKESMRGRKERRRVSP